LHCHSFQGSRLGIPNKQYIFPLPVQDMILHKTSAMPKEKNLKIHRKTKITTFLIVALISITTRLSCLFFNELSDLSNSNSLTLVSEGESSELLVVGVGLQRNHSGDFETGNDGLSYFLLAMIQY
jgi:hypothetical protein